MARFQRIETSEYLKLSPDDLCYYIGEYTARGGYGVSETNQQIHNLKKRPTSPAGQLHWKNEAIGYWARKLAAHLNLEAASRLITIVPAPCSKPADHPEYDPRMDRICDLLRQREPRLDIRPLLRTPRARPAQHEGDRMSIADLRNSMEIDLAHLAPALRATIIVVDDVFTQGGTFKAMQSLLTELPRVDEVRGIFLAKTVWPPIDFADLLDDE